jgi:hypothetical protein
MQNGPACVSRAVVFEAVNEKGRQCFSAAEAILASASAMTRNASV